NDTGVAFCWRADDGKEMWSAPLCGPVSASPILADGIIYQIDQQGKLVAFRDHPELFEKRFEVPLGTSAFATPTICHGRLFCRVIEQTVNGPIDTLYCFGLPDDGS
ncbi:MAG TPA: PQQ-binding-like beta-propeller repeat protein, partial [Planctomicrobium sp.]|nr:PQQ-binding-like beta-propeller repeat protein [Planctomicrobium sp.]